MALLAYATRVGQFALIRDSVSLISFYGWIANPQKNQMQCCLSTPFKCAIHFRLFESENNRPTEYDMFSPIKTSTN
ncbi:hypothetical protein DERP_004476 [Dermatophagoides pteronyssinus]|uniref:Uncharacterized protein n=1 Tax=Dermatophagoides pteronyssinus TaxID=6956 RepID=A0ABQ8JNW7_DERPT|nr:hypothetical protein DERP_004476 [Dermatophagoides pteronyssinus]